MRREGCIGNLRKNNLCAAYPVTEEYFEEGISKVVGGLRDVPFNFPI